MKLNFTTKEKFNALSNATHIFAYKEEKTKFKIIDIVTNEDATKAIVLTESGVLQGLFTTSLSARDALNEVFTLFGDEQPFVTVNMKTTKNNASVYYLTVE